MAQALLVTTLLTIVGLIATIFVGYTARTGADIGNHILVALATTVIGLFSQSMTLFFFIGTGKEIKDKAKGARDERDVVGNTRAFKNKVFPAALYAMLMLGVTFILGGGVHMGKVPSWLHQILAFASLALYARAYWIELQAMVENAKLMERFLR